VVERLAVTAATAAAPQTPTEVERQVATMATAEERQPATGVVQPTLAIEVAQRTPATEVVPVHIRPLEVGTFP
jgi:hypothetical protein